MVFFFLSFLLMLFPATQGRAGSKGRHEKRTIPFLCAPRLIKRHKCGGPLALRFHPAKPVRFKRAPGSCWRLQRGRTAGSADTSTATGTGPEEPRPACSPRTLPVSPGPPVRLWFRERVSAAAHKCRPRAAAASKDCGRGGR